MLLAVKGQHTDHALTQLPWPRRHAGRLHAERRGERAPGAAPLPRHLRHVRHVPGHPAPPGRDPGALGARLGPARPRPLPLGRRRPRARPSRTPSTPPTFQSVARPDIMRWKYRKLLMNLANAVEALCGPEGRFGPLAREAQREGKAVAGRGGHRRGQRRGGPRAAGRPPAAAADVARASGRAGSSWQSLARGRGFHRGRVPQRRDRPAGRAPRRADPGERAAATAGRPAAAEGAPPGSWTHRRAEREGGVRPWRVSAARHWRTTSRRPTPTRSSFARRLQRRRWRVDRARRRSGAVGVVLHHIAEGHARRAMAPGHGLRATAWPSRPRTSTGPTRRTRCGPRPSARPRRSRCSRSNGALTGGDTARPRRRGAGPHGAVRPGRWAGACRRVDLAPVPPATRASTLAHAVAAVGRGPLSRGGSVGVEGGAHLVGRVGLQRARGVDPHLVHRAREGRRRRVAGRHGEPGVVPEPQARRRRAARPGAACPRRRSRRPRRRPTRSTMRPGAAARTDRVEHAELVTAGGERPTVRPARARRRRGRT